MRSRRLCVLTHEASNSFWRTRFFSRYLVKHWKRLGIEVICARGPEEAVDADIGLLHLDMTQVEPAYVECMKRYPIALNTRVVDISKRSFSRQLLKKGDSYTGRVVVKTNDNFGGIPDARVDFRRGKATRSSTSAWSPTTPAGSSFKDWLTISEKLPWRHRRIIDPKSYPIFDSLSEVPPGVWRNPYLIVEKLLTEQDEEGNYLLRFWYFLGDKEIGELCTARHPIAKGKTIFRRELFQGPPEELRKIRAELGFDFGKFDYAIVNGKPVLYDINSTPTFGPIREKLFSESGIEVLARGINAF